MPVLLASSAGAIWGTVNYGPIGKPSKSAIECNNLHTFVTAEEASGKASWNEYRKLIDQYLAIDATSDQRVPIIESMASTVIDVLGHDLAIYKEMNDTASSLNIQLEEAVASQVDLTSTKNDWTKEKDGKSYLDSLRDRGRLQEAELLQREFAPLRLDLAGDGIYHLFHLVS